MQPRSSTPFFSVIMPVYNRADFLDEAIGSVRAQSFGDWELVLVDDGSTDASPGIIARHCQQDPRLRSLRQQNRGVASARNQGLAQARADWICYLDSDDIWFAETLAQFHRYITQHPSAQFVFGYRHRLRDGQVTETKPAHWNRQVGAAEIFAGCHLSTMCVTHRRELLAAVGGFDESLPSAEDYDLFLRMSRRVTMEPLGIATGLRRRHATNLSRPSGSAYLTEAAVLELFLAEGDAGLSRKATATRLRQLYAVVGKAYWRARGQPQALAAFARSRHYGWNCKNTLLPLLARLLHRRGPTDQGPLPLPLPSGPRRALPFLASGPTPPSND